MNNFDGQLDLYPQICIDNFSSNVLFNINIRCFILTHFHDDHMKNLEDEKFYKLLKNSNGLVKFYCSSITRKFIETCDKYSHLADLCTEVSCESPFMVNISEKQTLTVTFCGSGHCPGSVMVFIEGPAGNVLFTGDFRLPIRCASRLVFLKQSSLSNDSDKQKKIQDKSKYNDSTTSSNEFHMKECDHLYVDMTFFKPEIQSIPTREESVKALINFILKFLSSDKSKSVSKNDNQINFTNYIYLKTSARIGYEYVYQEIYKNTKYKVHVNDLIYKIYDQLPLIQETLTRNPYETPIHCCIYENRKRDVAKTDLMSSSLSKDAKSRKSYSTNSLSTCCSKNKTLIPCQLTKENEKFYDKTKINACKIILSAMWFTDTAGVDQIMIKYNPPPSELNLPAYKPYNSIYRLCYSFHSSFEEIVDFVDTLKPKKLFSIALPESTTDKLINEYFYTNDVFQGFHYPSKLSNSNGENEKKIYKENKLSFNLSEMKPLVLRKRKSFNKHLYNINNTENSSDNESSCSNESDDLNFGSDDDDGPSRSKILVK